MIHVYAFAAAETAPSDTAGIDGAAVECLRAGDVSVALSRHERAPAVSDAAVLRHAEVVDALMRSADAVLPARFGVAFEDELALRDAVAERADVLDAQLRRVEGCVELGLRVLAPDAIPPTEPVRGGADYLRARLRETNERQRLAAELHESLYPLARDSTHRAPPSGRLLLSAAYLVPADARERFEARVRELERAHGELALVCTGPWPPYSFATSTGEAA